MRVSLDRLGFSINGLAETLCLNVDAIGGHLKKRIQTVVQLKLALIRGI
jgi:hypothetical protein